MMDDQPKSLSPHSPPPPETEDRREDDSLIVSGWGLWSQWLGRGEG